MIPPATFVFPRWLPLIVIGFLALVVWQVLSARNDSRRPAGWRGIAPTGLRLLALTGMMWMLIAPDAAVTKSIYEEGLCFIAVDTSASMNTADERGGETRIMRVAKLLASREMLLGVLSSRAKMRRVFFDTDTREVDRFPNPDDIQTAGDATRTDITQLLHYIRNQAGSGRSSPVLIFTDGRHNATSDPLVEATKMRAAGLPVFFVGLGEDTPPKTMPDIALESLTHPDKIFEGEDMTIDVQLAEHNGFASAGTLRIKLDGEMIFSRPVTFNPLQSRQISFPMAAPDPGLHILDADIVPAGEDAVSTNNAQRGFFRVLRVQGLVWYLTSQPGWEQKFLLKVLRGLPDIRIIFRNEFLENNATGGHLPDSDSTVLPSTAEWESLRVLILGDIAPTRFSKRRQTAIAQFVNAGGTVMLLAGPNHSVADDWAGQPLYALSPVDWPARGNARAFKGVRVAPARGKSSHEALPQHMLDDVTPFPWRNAPEIPSVQPILRKRPGATVLVDVYSPDNTPHPLLIEQAFGQGHVLLLTSSSLWRWAFSSEDHSDMYNAFWTALGGYLAHIRMREADRLIFIDGAFGKLHDDEKAIVKVIVPAFDDRQAPGLSTAGVMLNIHGPSGTQSVQLGIGPGTYSEIIPSTEPGTYRVTARLVFATPPPPNRDGTMPLIKDELAFERVSDSVELRDLRPDHNLLRALAQRAGGKYFPSNQADKALERLVEETHRTVKTVATSRRWGRPPWLWTLIAFLFCGEWALRRLNNQA